MNSLLNQMGLRLLGPLLHFVFVVLALNPFPPPANAELASCTVQITIDTPIGVSTLDYIQRALSRSQQWQCSSMLLLLNTPGGNLQTTRLVVEEIVNSPIPFLCLVYPSGGHAGSAGAIILQACHVSGAVRATNIGAATPIVATGESLSEDLRKKMINDTKSWLEGLTKLRGRSQKFGQEIVTEAKSLDAIEAHRQGAIDTVAESIDDFLTFAKTKNVIIKKADQSTTVAVIPGEVKQFSPDLRFRALEFLTDPQFAYLLFMVSLALIYFEITHTGTIAPGVVGSIGLIISLISFHKLAVSWGGLALIFLGVGLLVAEAFVPSFGALGIGGIVSFFLGSLFLFDAEKSGYHLPLATIMPTILLLGAFMIGLAWFALKTRHLKKVGAMDDIDNQMATVVEIDSKNPCAGFVEIRGETWKYQTKEPFAVGDKVKIVGHRGLLLEVSRWEEPTC